MDLPTTDLDAARTRRVADEIRAITAEVTRVADEIAANTALLEAVFGDSARPCFGLVDPDGTRGATMTARAR